MASAKELKKKIRSISNTKKITRTMELVATSRSKRAQNRLQATGPYTRALGEILRSLARAGTVTHPLLESPPRADTTLVFAISSNRGFCGGYNTNLLALAEKTVREEGSKGKVEVYMAGRKGVARFRYLRLPVAQTFLNLDEKAGFAETEKVAQGLMDRFLKGELQKVLVVYTRYFSLGVQRPVVVQLLPIVAPGEAGGEAGKAGGAVDKAGGAGEKGAEKAGGAVEYIFEPEPRSILEALLPLSVKIAFFRMVLESVTSEQIARRMAMKMATDNAEEMIRHYTRFYNRTRQAGITQQINEIVSGASALE